jgi:hypothetical protein
MRKLRKFFSEKAVELLVAGVILQFAVPGISTWMGNRPALMLISASALLLLLFAFLGLKEIWDSDPPDIGKQMAFRTPRRGVIFTLGFHSAKKSSVVYLVNEKLKPELVGFLGTPQIEDVVKVILQELKVKEGKYKTESWSPSEIRDGKVKTSLVIDWMLNCGLKEEDIVVDLTGGTATMSIAAFMAAEEKRIDCQYILSEYDAKNQFIDGSQKPILITNYTTKRR